MKRSGPAWPWRRRAIDDVYAGRGSEMCNKHGDTLSRVSRKKKNISSYATHLFPSARKMVPDNARGIYPIFIPVARCRRLFPTNQLRYSMNARFASREKTLERLVSPIRGASFSYQLSIFQTSNGVSFHWLRRVGLQLPLSSSRNIGNRFTYGGYIINL